MTARQVQLCLWRRLEAQRTQQEDSRDPALSRRETEVLRRLTTGQEVGAIARQLSVSETAVTEHIRSVFRKARARVEADRAETSPQASLESSEP